MIVLQRIKCLAMRGRGLIVVFGLLLVGCSTPSVHFMREGVEATSLIRIDQEWMLQRLWRGDVGGGYREADSILHVSVDVLALLPRGKTSRKYSISNGIKANR